LLANEDAQVKIPLTEKAHTSSGLSGIIAISVVFIPDLVIIGPQVALTPSNNKKPQGEAAS
jgi:hypothetical protein